MKYICLIVLAALLKHAGAGCYSGTDPVMCTDTGCNGFCSEDNGCSCGSDETKTCVPTTCGIKDISSCCPSGYFWNSNTSCCSDELTCNPPCLSDEKCASVNDVATCVCNDSSYAGKKFADFSPLLTCLPNIMVISVSQCLLTHLGFDYTNMHLLNNDSDICNIHYPEIINNNRVESMQLKVQSGWCGNKMTFDSSKLYYKNSLYIGIQNKSVITVDPMTLNFTCSYNMTMQTSLIYALKPVLSTVSISGPNGTGSYALTMSAYNNPDYTSPIQAEDTVEVGTYIYLGLFVKDADGAAFTLRVEECYATPTSDPSDINKVYIVRGGCAYTNDVDSWVEQNGKALEARIKLSTFSFQSQTNVYIFCNAMLCPNTTNSQCDKCKTARASSTYTQTMINIPLDDNRFLNSGSQKAVSWTVMLGFILVLLKINN
ncbi:thyroid hormone down-regulated protein (gene 18) S homeolog precursor [Xenopus laevis]|uniref:Thyroid hormone down-regulated protein (Gene 18) S homeolog precursor n=1 Tax=Xenopus laevis TaxID=8355 RepID=Q91650_XENLA|nr:thyroid hormone down-regulated protein (gene 18) S homeolog precursor [Xenopus laevis]AAC59871.1 XL18 [Xenopus laevis]